MVRPDADTLPSAGSIRPDPRPTSRSSHQRRPPTRKPVHGVVQNSYYGASQIVVSKPAVISVAPKTAIELESEIVCLGRRDPALLRRGRTPAVPVMVSGTFGRRRTAFGQCSKRRGVLDPRSVTSPVLSVRHELALSAGRDCVHIEELSSKSPTSDSCHLPTPGCPTTLGESIWGKFMPRKSASMSTTMADILAFVVARPPDHIRHMANASKLPNRTRRTTGRSTPDLSGQLSDGHASQRFPHIGGRNGPTWTGSENFANLNPQWGRKYEEAVDFPSLAKQVINGARIIRHQHSIDALLDGAEAIERSCV